jgi:hypothetical protein
MNRDVSVHYYGLSRLEVIDVHTEHGQRIRPLEANFWLVYAADHD